MSDNPKPSPYHPTKGVYNMRFRKGFYAMIGGSVVVAAVALATPPAGVVSNMILAQGATVSALKEHVSVGNTWRVKLEDTGQSEFYFQDVVIGPSGRSGWHSHPSHTSSSKASRGVLKHLNRSARKLSGSLKQHM